MTFQPGQSGNPSGRPPNRPDKRNQCREMLQARAPELINKAIEMALSSDIQALRLCMERIIPKVTGHHLQLNMPSDELDDPNFLLSIGVEALKGVISGEITSNQAKDLTTILDAQRKMTETVQIKPIIEEIEKRIKSKNF